MPELPEVEIICRNLRDGTPDSISVLGLGIRNAQALWSRSLATPNVDEFLARMTGQSITHIGRRGKYIIFSLTRDTLLIHLRMSGDLIIELAGAPISKHARLMINFENGFRLALIDTRKFGRVWLTADPQAVIGRLGPEPLDKDFSSAALFHGLQAKKRQLKPLLLDQSFLAGLGNIYVDESLHLARLHPLINSRQITEEQAACLLNMIRRVLSEAIEKNGSSIDWVYRGGDFQNYFRVYNRVGQPCPDCGALIERIVVGKRGTHYCPQCQKLPASQA